MGLFILTASGKPQNLLLLQYVKAIESEKEPGKYALAYIQADGEIFEDTLYGTMAEAEAAANEIREELLS
ncbi:MAG: hypothetical protein IJF92_00075 [Bacilli bacterium]|nr:hypothetical protein [Bacilli bacterium]MBQ3307614.1 hypothetical protein [Bacilli bacterium]MBQ3422179.1 hypothetical protein [Romboutsia sp.]